MLKEMLLEWRVSDLKILEIETCYWGWRFLFEIHLRLVPKTEDHWGWRFNVVLLGCSLGVSFYDIRPVEDE